MTKHESPRKNLWVTGILCLILTGGISVFVYGVMQARGTLILMQTHNDMKWIGMALHRYHDEHGHFPPVVERDRTGLLLHSWRATIQPYLAAGVKTSEGFHAYDFRRPWDSDVNNSSTYHHRFEKHPFEFLAVVGPHAAWTRDETRKMSDFKDGTSNTILVIGIRDTGIHWYEPLDAEFDGQNLTIGGKPIDPSQTFFGLMADGSVRYGLTSKTLAPLLTIDAGDPAPEW